MMQDREQKRRALKLSVSQRWFPQLEVDVHPDHAISEQDVLVTDLDVISFMPDEFRGFRAIVFDCKTKARESAVNRALWLTGVLKRMNADQGFCILKKDSIYLDHVLMANRLGVILLSEGEFDLYARATCVEYSSDSGCVGDIDVWDRFFLIGDRFKRLAAGIRFIRSGFWMIDNPAEACRKTIASLLELSPELDPSKPEHVCLFLDYCAIFSKALAVFIVNIFKSYLHPRSQGELSEALLVMLYGGRDAYQHRNELYQLLMTKNPDASLPGLSLPEWSRFVQLARQLLDAPLAVQKVPLILREVAFCVLKGDSTKAFARSLCDEAPQAARFAVLIPTYMSKAAKLPSDFFKNADSLLLPLISAK